MDENVSKIKSVQFKSRSVFTGASKKMQMPKPGTMKNHTSPVEKQFSQLRNKRILIIFILLITALVGIRLWANGKKNEVSSPNFITASGQTVAVSWGRAIYLLDHEGNVTGREALSPSVELSQIKLINNELWIADYTSKSVYKLKDGMLSRVLNGDSLIRNAFKFTLDNGKDKIYVTDSSNHKVYIYNIDGSFVKSFGKEGKGVAELKFPNSIVLDKDGNLLIVNTNAFRLDIYSLDGNFLKTLADVEAVGKYKYPTLLTQSRDKIIFLLAKNGLQKSKILVYDDQGRFSGELFPPQPLQISGDVASWDNNVLVTDNETRKIHLFNVDTMAYIGSFSKELEELGIKDTQEAKYYDLISFYSLIVLLLVAAPVFFLLVRQRRREAKVITAADITQLIPNDAIWAVEIKKGKLVAAVALFVLLVTILGAVSIAIAIAFLGAVSRAIALRIAIAALVLLIFSIILLFYAPRLLFSSGFGVIARRKIVEKMLKSALPKIKQIMEPDENIVGCTALQTSRILKLYALLILTNRRLIIIDFTLDVIRFAPAGISQFGYRNITKVSIESVDFFMFRLMKAKMYAMRLALQNKDGLKELNFYLMERQILDKLKATIDEKRIQGDLFSFTDVTDAEAKTAVSGFRGKEKSGKWIAFLLSLLFPGFGQFYNRQIFKGALFSAIFSINIIILISPLTTIVQKSAEYSQKNLFSVIFLIIASLFFYSINLADAYYTRKKIDSGLD